MGRKPSGRRPRAEPKWRLLPAVVFLVMTADCSRSNPGPAPGTASTPAASPTETLPTTHPQVVFPDGFSVLVETAADDPTREQGLMYRDSLAEDHGMLFFFVKPGLYPFWMKNTLIPLDMIWLDQDRKIVHIEKGVPPCKSDPCPSYGPGTHEGSYVLETATGVAEKHGLKEGAQLQFEGLERTVIR